MLFSLRKAQQQQSRVYLVNACLEPTACTYGKMTRIFNVPVWRDGFLMVHTEESEHMYTLEKNQILERYHCFLKPSYKFLGSYFCCCCFQEKAYAKVYDEQTNICIVL